MIRSRARALALDARQQGNTSKNGDLLAKLRTILLGPVDTPPTPPPPPPRSHDPGNAELKSRLQRILTGRSEEDDPATATATIHLGSVARSLARQGKTEEAMRLCREMGRRGSVPDITVISAFPAAKLGAGECVLDLPQSRQELPPHSSLIKLLCKGGRFVEASKTAMAMMRQGIAVETSVLNTLVYGLYKVGDTKQCFQILQEMLASSSSSGDIDPSLGGEEDAVVRRVCGALDELIERSICPDVVFYTTLVDGLCAAGKIDEAYFLYKNSASKNEYGVSTCNALVQGLIERGRGGEVFPLVLGMVKNGLTLKNGVLNSLLGKDDAVLPALSLLDHKSMLEGLCGLRKVDEAVQFFGEMIRKGGIEDTETLDSLLLELCKSVIYKPESYKLFDRITKTVTSSSLCSASTHNILVKFLFKAGRTEDVHKLVKRMLDEEQMPDCGIYNSLVVKLCDGENRVDDALILLKRATCTVNSATSNCVLRALCKGGGSVDVAVKFVDWMRTKDHAPDAASSAALIARLIKEKKIEKAFAMYHDSMVPRRFKLDKDSYDSILGGLWESGKEAEALKLFQQMVRNGVVPDARTSNILIAGLCKSRKVDAALKIAGILPTMGCIPELRSYNTLLSALCDRNESKSVNDVVNDMTENGLLLDSESYNTALLCFARSGCDEDLQKLFVRMMDQGCEATDETYELVFGCLARAENLDGAAEALQSVIRAGFLPLKKCAYRPYLVALLKAGRIDQAIELFEGSIGNPDPAILLDCFLEAGLVPEACSYYEKTVSEESSGDGVLVRTICEGKGGETLPAACKFVNDLGLRKKDKKISVGRVVLELLRLRRLDLAAGGVKIGCANRVLVRRVADCLLEESKVDELCRLFGVVAMQDEFEIGLARKYIRKLVARGEIDVANRIFETAVGGGGGGDRETRKKTIKRSGALYDLVIADFCRLGKFEEGARVLEHLFDNGVLPRGSEL